MFSKKKEGNEMAKKTDSMKMITEQLIAHNIEFGERYKDRASGFEGQVTAIYFFEHGCMRVALRGTNHSTGEPAEAVFDAPELISVATAAPVPASSRKGGPHDLHMDTRGGRP